MPEFETKSWLVHTEFLSKTKEQLQSHLKFALQEINDALQENPKYYAAQVLSQLLQTQDIDQIEYIYEIKGFLGSLPNSPHVTAPPYQYFWKIDSNFYLLTIHQES